jgi:sucrose-6F-phosphate phosphohydrolase
MRSPRILVSDIDGTLLKGGLPTEGLAELRRRVAREGNGLRLVYATGRCFGSTWSLIRRGLLPLPDAIAAQIGTELWLPPWQSLHPGYARHLSESWDDGVVREVLGRFPQVRFQEEAHQSPWKVSGCLAPEDVQSVLTALRRALAERGVVSRVVYSGRRFLDVLPARSGKLSAVRFLRGLWDGERSVLAAGDSGNDLDMIAHPATAGVVVGNASDGQLEHLSSRQMVYRARRHYAAGVLEGGAAFGFWG